MSNTVWLNNKTSLVFCCFVLWHILQGNARKVIQDSYLTQSQIIKVRVLGYNLLLKELHVVQVENTISTQHKAVLDVLQIRNHIADNKQFYIRMCRNTGPVSREPIKIACLQPRSICAWNTMQLWIFDPNENKGLEME